jgi:acetyltransferase-like isoleucine patch superfamily enzyme
MASSLRKAVCAALLLGGRIPILGRPFREAARVAAGPYKDRQLLAYLTPRPWISPRAEVRVLGGITCGDHVFIDDGCVIYSGEPGCRVVLGNRVAIHRGTIIHLGKGSVLEIGERSSIQASCTLTPFGPIRIGRNVLIAPHCALYPYDHSFHDVQSIIDQPVQTRGGITIEDDVWLGFGVIVLDGVTIGRGAVVAAGSVVSRDIPPMVIAAGMPARVVGTREGP